MTNTLGLAMIGYALSLVPPAFGILLFEIKSTKFRKFVQTTTTLPAFISMVLFYAVIWSMFSTNDGFINKFLIDLGAIHTPVNFLGSTHLVWFRMVMFGMWKGLGWSAIIFLAAIVAIDQELYEAATIDGAGRFRRMWHITVPGIVPTFFVSLILSIANLLNSGMEMYYLFKNPMILDKIEVLDLYVYNIGIVGSRISAATAIGIMKTFISLILLFTSNALSKKIRGSSIF